MDDSELKAIYIAAIIDSLTRAGIPDDRARRVAEAAAADFLAVEQTQEVLPHAA